MAFQNFRRFVMTKGFKMDHGDPREVTYSTLNGMCLHVPPEKRCELYAHIAEWGLDERSDITLSENRSSDAARVYFDIDGSWPEIPTKRELTSLGKLASNLISKVAPDEDTWCIVLGPSKNVKGKLGPWKFTCHLVFPDVFATADMQSALVEGMNVAMKKDPTLSKAALAGEIQADDTRALRTAFTIKAAKCGECGRAPKSGGGGAGGGGGMPPAPRPKRVGECEACVHGYVYDRRWFELVTVLDRHGEFDITRFGDMHAHEDLLAQTSIRSDGRSPNVPSTSLTWTTITQETGQAPRTNLKRCTKETQKGTEEADNGELPAFRALPLFSMEVDVMRDFMRREFGGHFRDVGIKRAVTSATLSRKGSVYVAFMEGPGAKRCPNIEWREHSGRSGYIVFTTSDGRHVARHRCSCKCDTIVGRKSGKPCKVYRSDDLILGPKEESVLFGSNVASFVAGAEGQRSEAEAMRVPPDVITKVAAAAENPDDIRFGILAHALRAVSNNQMGSYGFIMD